MTGENQERRSKVNNELIGMSANIGAERRKGRVRCFSKD
jgi:hypothetical protein